jgi:hypothetical protein
MNGVRVAGDFVLEMLLLVSSRAGDDRLPNLVGIGPLKELPYSKIHESDSIDPNSGGILPDSELSLRGIEARELRSPNSVGMDPEKALLPMSRRFSMLSCPRLGREPGSILLNKLKVSRDVSSPTSLDNAPTSKLSCRYRLESKDSCASSDGRDPVKRLFSR